MHSRMDERTYIAICTKSLSEKFQLEPGKMQERDFEFVSQKVRETTKVDLSTATLRRIWTDRYQKTPQIKTLDALAKTLDYQGWHEFKIHHHSTFRPGGKKSRVPYLWLISMPFIAAVIWAYTHLNDPEPGEVYFQPETQQHRGVPATIGFHYDIRNIRSEVVIQLSWNPYEQTILDPKQSFYTGTYFYPDFHEAKLISDGRILARSQIHITTETWNGLLMKEGLDPNPIQLNSSDFIDGKRMVITSEQARASGIFQQAPYFPVFTLSNEQLDSISVDDMVLDFMARLLPAEQPQNCRSFDVLIKGADGRIRLPICETGCYGLFDLSVGAKVISGKTTDLSLLSWDINVPTHVSIRIEDQKLSVNVGEQDPLIVDYPDSLGPLKVIKFIPIGPGYVENVQFKASKVVETM